MAEAGHLIGPYRLLSVLGRGAMGEVWRARDERLDRLVALKLLPRDQTSSDERRARMIREAKAAASIRHPNIVTLFDIVTEDGEDVLVMELVDGQTLAERLAESGPMMAEEALDVLAGLCDALVAAHAEGVLHRDVKTANVMLDGSGAIKVLDFGLAKLRTSDDAPASAGSPPAAPIESASGAIALDETLASVDERRLSATMPAGAHTSIDDRLLVTRAGQILGTPMYMAPEQFAGEVPTELSEVFSVGVVAHEILSGAPPFAADSYEDLQTKVFNAEPPPLPSTVPRELADVVSKALAKEPEERFASMAALRDSIEELRARARRPSRWVWALAAVTPLAIIAVAAAVMFSADDGPSAEPERPGDRAARQALAEFNLFYNQKAAASLRAAIREAPDNPLAYAYTLLFPTESGSELDRVVSEARRVRRLDGISVRERALLDAGIVLATEGPLKARASFLASARETSADDGEMAFWAAELAFRARDYDVAMKELAVALEISDKAFHGRIFDHYSAVLSYFGKHDEALVIGRRYAEAFSGEADAVGVYATTLARVGKLDEALEAATEARRLYEGEDTVAGLAKIHAYRGELEMARKLYRKSAAMAPEARRPIRNAALGWLAWIAGDDEAARRAVADCLPGGDDDQIWQRGACLWVAGTIDPGVTAAAIRELDKLATAGTALRPPYGFPANLANLLRARQIWFAGACRRAPADKPADEAAITRRNEYLRAGSDFFAAYHIPFFSDYASCELAGGEPTAP